MKATARKPPWKACNLCSPYSRGGQQVQEGGFITAGNASQLSDGASACVLMDSKEAERLGLQPLGAYRGMAVAGCDPRRNGYWPGVCGAQTAQAFRPHR